MLMQALNTSEVALDTWGVSLSDLCPLINLKHHLKTDVELSVVLHNHNPSIWQAKVGASEMAELLNILAAPAVERNSAPSSNMEAHNHL